jgi:alkylresorcinol/alkylpyrone synthase
MVKLNAVSSVAGDRAVPVEETVRFFLPHCPGTMRSRLQRSLEQSGNRRRHLVMPLQDLARLGGAGERTDRYRRHAAALAERAVAPLADGGALGARDVSTVVLVSSTGFVAPSIDTHVVRRFGLDPACRRIPLAQLGCGGGVAALSLAAEIVARDPAERVLVVSVEIPSLHLQLAEPSYFELVAASQFGDGAAAAVVSSDGRGAEVVATASVLLPEVEEGGRVLPCETGFRLVAAPGLPAVIRSRVRELVTRITSPHGLDADGLGFVLAHPRGRDVLDAVADGLPANRAQLAGGYAAWADGGNMVSASIYRAFAALARDHTPADGDVGLLVAFGTGVACEMALVRWRAGTEVLYA